MIKFINDFIDSKVILFQERIQVGAVSDVIIEAKNGSFLGFFVSLFPEGGEKVVSVREMKGFGNGIVMIHEYDSLSEGDKVFLFKWDSYSNNKISFELDTDILIKNNWSKYVMGAEFTMFGNTVNLYAGQHMIDDFQKDEEYATTNFLVGQMRERTDFISGHINANFLTGDALNMILLAAGYWDEEGEAVQTNVKATFKYKIANGLDLIFSPSYMDLLDNKFTDYQFEVKYSF